MVGMREQDIIRHLEESAEYIKEFERGQHRTDYGDWEERVHKETAKLIDRKNRLSAYHLRNFQGLQIFVSDCPNIMVKGFYNPSKFYYMFRRLVDHFVGSVRAGRKFAINGFNIIKDRNLLDLLDKYPLPAIGNPYYVKCNGRHITYRYLRHIYFLGLFREYLGHRLSDEFTMLDLGCSYGVFSSLIKNEYPKSHHVLVDLPGQLMLAYYYLASMFPDARIARFEDIGQLEGISKGFVSRYDFVLVPTTMYHLLENSSVDIYANFVSLSEMNRAWFDMYMTSDVFTSAEYFFTVNRYDSRPTYTNDITVLDYPLSYYENIHMKTNEYLKEYYVSSWFFKTKKLSYPSQLFEFIGRRTV